jgi:hypothetical protein
MITDDSTKSKLFNQFLNHNTENAFIYELVK